MSLEGCFDDHIVVCIATYVYVPRQQNSFGTFFYKDNKLFYFSLAVISYLSLILGRLRTSINSSSMGAEITHWKSLCSKDSLSRAGYPCGLIKAEIHTFVSMTTLSAISFFPCLFQCFGYIPFNFFRAIWRSFPVYFFNEGTEFCLPFVDRNNLDGYNFTFFYINGMKRFKDAVLKYGVDNLGHDDRLLFKQI